MKKEILLAFIFAIIIGQQNTVDARTRTTNVEPHIQEVTSQRDMVRVDQNKLKLQRRKEQEEQERLARIRYHLNEEELYFLVRLVNAEVRDYRSLPKQEQQSYIIATLQVVLNRTYHSNWFPDTVEEVGRQKHQFAVMRDGSFEKTKVSDYVEELIVDYINGDIDKVIGDDVMFFAMSYCDFSDWAQPVATIGHHTYWT